MPTEPKPETMKRTPGKLHRAEDCDVTKRHHMEFVCTDADALVARVYGASREEAVANAEDGVSITEEVVAALEMLLDSAVPHPTEHPTMTAAWAHGRTVLAEVRKQKEAQPTK